MSTFNPEFYVERKVLLPNEWAEQMLQSNIAKVNYGVDYNGSQCCVINYIFDDFTIYVNEGCKTQSESELWQSAYDLAIEQFINTYECGVFK
jgi:hypothetical protein